MSTQYMTVFNGKHGGGRMVLNPMSIINDGFFEVLYYNGLMGFSKSMSLFQGAKTGGTHIYDKNGRVYRVSKLKLVNKLQEIQDINIDGEDLEFKDFVTYECLHQELEFIVNFEQMFKK